MDSMSSSSASMSSSSDSMSNMTTEMSMKPYLHFTKGDILIFDSIAPSSPGAIFGACILLFFVSLLERGLRAFCRGLQHKFATRTQKLHHLRFVQVNDPKAILSDDSQGQSKKRPQYILSHEIIRGLVAGFDTAVHYFLMLVVMTFNASFIISIIVGAVVGEMLFGRFHQAH